jgi:hypothetical protein
MPPIKKSAVAAVPVGNVGIGDIVVMAVENPVETVKRLFLDPSFTPAVSSIILVAEIVCDTINLSHSPFLLDATGPSCALSPTFVVENNLG